MEADRLNVSLECFKKGAGFKLTKCLEKTGIHHEKSADLPKDGAWFQIIR